MTDGPLLPLELKGGADLRPRRSRGGRPARCGQSATASKVYCVRLSAPEKDAIQAAANALEVSMAELMRAGALIAADRPATLPQEALAVHRAAEQLAIVGRLLNQIARSLQSQDRVDTEAIRDAVIATQERTRRLAQSFRAMLLGQSRRGRLARAQAVRSAGFHGDAVSGEPPE